MAVPPVVAGASTSSEASLSSSGLSLLLLAVSHNCVVVVDCVPSNGVVRNEWSADVVVVLVIGVVGRTANERGDASVPPVEKPWTTTNVDCHKNRPTVVSSIRIVVAVVVVGIVVQEQL